MDTGVQSLVWKTRVPPSFKSRRLSLTSSNDIVSNNTNNTSTPLLGLGINGDKWREIEVKNLIGLLSRMSHIDCVFFKVGVHFYDVQRFVTSCCIELRLHYEKEYICIENSPDESEKYLLLYEPFNESLQNSLPVKLIGIALFKAFSGTIPPVRQSVDVSFLSLSRSGLDMLTLDEKNHFEMINLLEKYIECIQNETANPYLNNVYVSLYDTD